MALLLHSQELLGDKGHPIGYIPCLSSEEVITVFCCGTLELAIDELSITSRSYDAILQHFMWLCHSSSSEQILVGRRFCAAKKFCSNLCLKMLAYWRPHGCSMCLDEELVVEGEDVVVEDEV
eukprot:g20829.t1